ncbi:unnamed protein product, partial [Didymodactylos carnosus]
MKLRKSPGEDGITVE